MVKSKGSAATEAVVDVEIEPPGETPTPQIVADAATPPAPLKLSELSREDLAALVERLQQENANVRLQARIRDPYKTWEPDEKITVRVPLGPTGQPLTINGKAIVGNVTMLYKDYASLNERLTRAWDVENRRMEQRGNAAPIEVVGGDVASTLGRLPSELQPLR